MAAGLFDVQLSGRVRRRAWVTLTFINVAFTATTAAFIALWERRDQLSPGMKIFTRYVLVQGHLATENVLAAWYSSMLMLVIGAGALIAFAADRRGRAGMLTFGWLIFAGLFILLSLDEIGSFHERIGMVTAPGASGRAIGWAYLLAIPIAVVGIFMFAFGWFHVRRVRRAFRLITAGVTLFLLNPVLEVIEMALIHGAGATAGTWQRSAHDLLLVLEEGGLELFGILCFLAAIVTYVVATAGERSVWRVDERVAVWTIRFLTLALIVGTWAARWVVARLPPGDTGIPQNWFPAAALLLLALGAPRLLALPALALSAFFGSGLHGYTTWHSFEVARVVLLGTLTVLFGIGGWVNRRGTGRITAAAAVCLMGAAVSLTSEYVPLLAIASAGLAAEGAARAAIDREARRTAAVSADLLARESHR